MGGAFRSSDSVTKLFKFIPFGLLLTTTSAFLFGQSLANFRVVTAHYFHHHYRIDILILSNSFHLILIIFFMLSCTSLIKFVLPFPRLHFTS